VVIAALILTAAAVAIGTAGVLLADCSSTLLNVVSGDPLQLCATVTSLGMTPEPWMGIGLIAMGPLALFAGWAPTRKRKSTKADLASITALQRNLDRVEVFSNPVKGGIPAPTPAPAPEPKRGEEARALRGLIEDLRQGFEENRDGDSVMTTWIATLHICNDLNNTGVLSPAEFKELNTSLLALVTPDIEELGETTETSV